MTSFADIAPTVGKLLRLLGSDRPGEVVAAVRALRRVLRSADRDLHDLANAIEIATHRGALHDNDDALGMIRRCYRHADHLSSPELKFIHAMAKLCCGPPPPQLRRLRAIHEQCLERERGRAHDRRERAAS
jgi:hypothetical protein